MNLSSKKTKKTNILLTAAGLILFAVGLTYTSLQAQNISESVSDIEKQKREAESEIKEARSQLGANEKKVTECLATLRKIDDDIAVSQNEIATYQGQLESINANIDMLEAAITAQEDELIGLRGEYLNAVKKIRVARKRNSGLVFLLSSKSWSEAKRKIRYMQEFSDWRERRTDEITGVIDNLNGQYILLAQAQNDAAVALQREEKAQEKLAQQKIEQEATVAELEANSEALKDKIAKRQAEVRNLGNQISKLIAEEQAKEEAKRKAEEERIAKEKAKKAEEERLAKEKKAEEERLAQEKAKKSEEEKQAKEKAKKGEQEKKAKEEKSKAEERQIAESKSNSNAESDANLADASKRRQRKPAEEATTPAQKEPEVAAATVSASGTSFESMMGRLPRPVAGSFKIISAFGVHPISPELPNIMEENLGIDVHVQKDAGVMAVYDGEVIKIYDRTTIPGFRNIVVMKHGDYITVYANIETLAVKSGQKVKQGETLGYVGTDFDDPDYGMIHFELWKNQTRLDPAAWLQ